MSVTRSSLAIGFDYGTSNCAMGLSLQGQTGLIPLGQDHSAYVPSTLYTVERAFITEYIARNLRNSAAQASFVQQREHTLGQALGLRRSLGISADEPVIRFGQEAIDEYLQAPEEGVFIKSPKSFLGATALSDQMLLFFEDVVAAKMLYLKTKAENLLETPIGPAAIGRPINFQGRRASESNTQALDLLTRAAERAGFSEVVFLYEPVAAGLHYESSLSEEQLVLVVDIGGGTSDCAMLRMGPERHHRLDRDSDILGHAGERIGGNDVDIQLAFQTIMPHFGLHTALKTGLPMPIEPFWQAVAVNDVNAQAQFYQARTKRDIEALLREAKQPEALQRFGHLQAFKQNYQLVQQAERSKIILGEQAQHTAELDFTLEPLSVEINERALAQAIERSLGNLNKLIGETVAQAGSAPDVVFLTGGSAQSPQLKALVESHFPQTPVLGGDDFGSVVTGLSHWANILFDR